MNDLLEAGNTGDLSSTELVGQSLESCNFECDLNLVDRLAVAGHANTKTVVGEGSVALLESLVDIAVVVVVVGEIPVGAVEANAMGEELHGVGSSVGWSAVGGGQIVGSGKVRVLCDC